jgi:hypothetical protein
LNEELVLGLGEGEGDGDGGKRSFNGGNRIAPPSPVSNELKLG